MKTEAVKCAVAEFVKLRDELRSVIDAMGFKALTVMVHQKGQPEEMVWACTEIGVHDPAGVFWGVFQEERPRSSGRIKDVKVYLDTDSINYIEFEYYAAGDDEEDIDV